MSSFQHTHHLNKCTNKILCPTKTTAPILFPLSTTCPKYWKNYHQHLSFWGRNLDVSNCKDPTMQQQPTPTTTTAREEQDVVTPLRKTNRSHSAVGQRTPPHFFLSIGNRQAFTKKQLRPVLVVFSFCGILRCLLFDICMLSWSE
jgi:hypothetical protein